MAEGSGRALSSIGDLLAQIVDGNGTVAIPRALEHLAEPDRWAPQDYPNTPPRILASGPPNASDRKAWDQLTTIGLSDKGRTCAPRETSLRTALNIFRWRVFRVEQVNAGKLGGVLWAIRVLRAAGGYDAILRSVRVRVQDSYGVDVDQAPGDPLGDRDFIRRHWCNLKALPAAWRGAGPGAEPPSRKSA